MSVLHDEIVEAQKQRADLMRWKLILIAAIATVGFGLGNKDQEAAPWVLATMPFVCAYVDAMYVHLALRIIAIGAYRRKHADDLKLYEKFVHDLHAKSARIFGTEYGVSVLSSVVANGALVGYASTENWRGDTGWVGAAGAVGILLTSLLAYHFKQGAETIRTSPVPGESPAATGGDKQPLADAAAPAAGADNARQAPTA